MERQAGITFLFITFVLGISLGRISRGKVFSLPKRLGYISKISKRSGGIIIHNGDIVLWMDPHRIDRVCF